MVLPAYKETAQMEYYHLGATKSMILQGRFVSLLRGPR